MKLSDIQKKALIQARALGLGTPRGQPTLQTANNTVLHDIIRRHPNLRPSTKRIYFRDLDRWVAFAGGNPTGWTRYRAQAFYEQLLLSIKPQSANRIMATLSSAASWWAKLESQPELDFTQILLAQNKARKPRKALLPQEAEALIRACVGSKPEDLRDLAVVVVGLETGMRAMSLGGMQIENINTQAGYRAAYVPLKGRDELYPVPLSGIACLALDPWLHWLREQKITSGPVMRNMLHRVDKKLRLGDGMCLKTLFNIIERRGEIAGLDLHPHLLRHSMITWRLQAGIPPHIISVITGHRMGDQLAQLYDYMDKSGFIEAACATTPPWLAELVKEIVKP